MSRMAPLLSSDICVVVTTRKWELTTQRILLPCSVLIYPSGVLV